VLRLQTGKLRAILGPARELAIGELAHELGVPLGAAKRLVSYALDTGEVVATGSGRTQRYASSCACELCSGRCAPGCGFCRGAGARSDERSAGGSICAKRVRGYRGQSPRVSHGAAMGGKERDHG
jgi:hypothetical protein